MASKGKSGHGRMHPYMNPNKWVNGELCFWRERPQMYTAKAHDYFETFIEDLKSDVRLAHRLEDNLHQS